jgi:hypothetical protein
MRSRRAFTRASSDIHETLPEIASSSDAVPSSTGSIWRRSPASSSPPGSPTATALIGQLGFDTVDAGPLAQSWRIEPETTAYTRLYLADPATPSEQIMQAPARPVPAAELHRALEAVERLHVADRTF